MEETFRFDRRCAHLVILTLIASIPNGYRRVAEHFRDGKHQTGEVQKVLLYIIHGHGHRGIDGRQRLY